MVVMAAVVAVRALMLVLEAVTVQPLVVLVAKVRRG